MMFTVREKDYIQGKYKYDKNVAMKYANILSRLKFSDRSAYVIEFSKYPHHTWTYREQQKSTYAIQYYLRIDGMRQMRVWINGMRLFNVNNQLKPSPKALWDDNFVDPKIVFTMASFVQSVKDELEEIKKDYLTIRREVFGEEVSIFDITIDTHSLEVVREGLGLHTSDVSYMLSDFPMCDSVKVYHNETNTHYFNTSAKRQLKFYNKGVGVLRMEATFNYRPKDIVYNWVDPTEHIVQSIESEFDELLFDMNIPSNWYEAFKVNQQNLIFLIATALNLKTKTVYDPDTREVIGGGELMLSHTKTLLESPIYQTKSFGRNLIQRLKNMGLIEPATHGKWKATLRLQYLKDLYRIVQRTKQKDVKT